MPFKQRGTLVYEETMLALQRVPLEFGMEIIVLGSWNIWIQRNGKVFKIEQPTIQNWRRILAQDLNLLQHRIKGNFKPKLLEWISNNLR